MPPSGEAVQDSILIARLRSRDETALETLIASYGARIFGPGAPGDGQSPGRRGGPPDTLWSVLRHVEVFRGDAKLSSWIYRIAMNAALMKVRRRRRKTAHLSLDENLGPAMTEDGALAEPVADWTDRSGELERKELLQRLAEAVERLPPEDRAVSVLRDVEGLSTEEACEVLSLSAPALKNRLHRARLFLRKALSDYVTGGRSEAAAGGPR